MFDSTKLFMGRFKRFHFVGIGGCGMSGMAEILLKLGFEITGSDLVASKVTERLQALGATLFIGHHADYLTKNTDAVVYTTMAHDTNPEIHKAKQLKIPLVKRGEMLAELMRPMLSIAVAGTHGKTSTTGLISEVLLTGGKDPTLFIGGELTCIQSHAHLGKGAYCVAEADESDASFLYMYPLIAVVTNIDADHMEHYQGDFSKIEKNFLAFLQKIPFYGLAILCGDDPVIQKLRTQLACRVTTYGLGENVDVQAIDLHQEGVCTHFHVQQAGKPKRSIVLNAPGEHNVLNALAAITVADEVGVTEADLTKALANYTGVGRRFQWYPDRQCNEKQFTLINDYGHHPREISVTCQAIRNAWPQKRLLLVFQPHRYTRTQAFLTEFAAALTQADHVLLLPVYAACEDPIEGADSQAIYEQLKKSTHTTLLKDEKTFFRQFSTLLQHDDIVLMQGAGTIGNMAERLLEECTRVV